MDEIQSDLIFDYRENVAMYPFFQEYLRRCQPPLLAAWGKNDPSFIYPGAECFKRDVENVEVYLLDTGHFALETDAFEVSQLIIQFLGKYI